MVNLDYFYGSEGEQYRFYQIPAILLEDEEYKKISDTAKLLYGILLSRLALSKKNNWILHRIQGRELVSLGSNPMLLRGETSSCL